MTGLDTVGILGAENRTARTSVSRRRWGGVARAISLVCLALGCLAPVAAPAAESLEVAGESAPPEDQGVGMHSVSWDFGRSTDTNFDRRLDGEDGWESCTDVGYPKYVTVAIEAHDPELERQFRKMDAAMIRVWPWLRKNAMLRQYVQLPPLPPSPTDAVIDRFLKVTLDGGQMKLESPLVATSHVYQYRFTCRIKTEKLRHDSAYAELVFLDKNGKELAAHPTRRISGTNPWTTVQVDRVHPPNNAVSMRVRLVVHSADDGLEDIHGTIGFDDLRIDHFPQLQLTTNEPLGIYYRGEPIETKAKIMGLPLGPSRIIFRLHSIDGTEDREHYASVEHPGVKGEVSTTPPESINSEVRWRLPNLPPGYYRVTASLVDGASASLATESTFAVIDRLVEGPPHGSFGWSLPAGAQGISPHHLASWLSKLGVAWAKVPCWLAPDDNASAEHVAVIFTKLQDAGIETVGVLDAPPEDQQPNYDVRGSRVGVASQWFQDVDVWQPLLEPVMTRMTLKVRTWQLGADRDHSFLGRPRLQESIKQISLRLQGFGQPIDVAISWPWLESHSQQDESSWQAICRSSDRPLIADELDAFLSLTERRSSGNGTRTWLLLDPIAESKYDRDARIRDLVLRMATVRDHRVQAAFVSDPRHPQHGLLNDDGRPGELLLPWRTTSRLIGNLRNAGSLRMRSGADNAVFTNNSRAVLLVWSAKPTEELIYLGDDVRSVDVWGKVSKVPVEQQSGQWVQRIKIGPMPRFIIGVDQALLNLRMSVAFDQDQLDSFLGQVQPLSLSFSNPTRDSLVGEVRVMAPERWSIEYPKRSWEMLGGRVTNESFNVVLGSSAKIGEYEVPIRFELQTVPPKRFTVYRTVGVGPAGLALKVNTRLVPNGNMRVQIEITNRSQRTLAYDCKIFPPLRQYQRRFITARPGESIRRDIYLPNGEDLVGGKMLLRAVEQDGRRILNYTVDVRR